MINTHNIAITILLILFSGCSAGKGNKDEIVACGDDKVLIIDKMNSEGENVKVVWQWSVPEAGDLPSEMKKLMIPTDDCKPVDGNRKILVTSSGGGVVLIDRKTKKTLFYARVPMAHSAEYLPGSRIAVALSTAPAGNCLELFDIKKPDEVVFKDSLYSGHGVVWMASMKRLFALGFNELREYSLLNWKSDKPELQLMRKWELPGNGGHDLSRISDSELLLTTTRGVWRFKVPEEKFTPFELLNQSTNIKSVNYDPKTNELVYTKAEISWWTHHIYIKNPDKVITIPDIDLYKARTSSR